MKGINRETWPSPWLFVWWQLLLNPIKVWNFKNKFCWLSRFSKSAHSAKFCWFSKILFQQIVFCWLSKKFFCRLSKKKFLLTQQKKKIFADSAKKFFCRVSKIFFLIENCSFHYVLSFYEVLKFCWLSKICKIVARRPFWIGSLNHLTCIESPYRSTILPTFIKIHCMMTEKPPSTGCANGVFPQSARCQ